MNIGLGIDTGGTYTDTVLMDMDCQKILSKAKALTTRDDLSVGIRNSINKLDHGLFPEIVLVSMSSTLATNSIVEGKGCRVALISVGRRFDKTIVADEVLEIAGGHDLNGKAAAELELDKVRGFLQEVGEKVDAIAISSYLSVRNPEHEVAIKALANEMTELPIICGHELTSSLGFDERTLTAVLNARLIPIIKDLMLSVKKALKNFEICAPLMIVKGDGSIMGEAVALEKPVETILSGPASSLTGPRSSPVRRTPSSSMWAGRQPTSAY
ncbi:MAG: hydantoinase/oxoprolinase N-terminal domain-containing protein [Candidatus Methanomethylophilaceae archaeon]